MSIRNEIASPAKSMDTDPTDAQIEAGNDQQKGHVQLHGMHVVLEKLCGSTRSGIDADDMAGHLISWPSG